MTVTPWTQLGDRDVEGLEPSLLRFTARWTIAHAPDHFRSGVAAGFAERQDAIEWIEDWFARHDQEPEAQRRIWFVVDQATRTIIERFESGDPKIGGARRSSFVPPSTFTAPPAPPPKARPPLQRRRPLASRGARRAIKAR